MGRRGPPPKPTALKLFAGTFRKDRAPKREPKPAQTKGFPKPPSFLGQIAKQEWRRVVPELHKLGILTKVDRAALAAYCESYEITESDPDADFLFGQRRTKA